LILTNKIVRPLLQEACGYCDQGLITACAASDGGGQGSKQKGGQHLFHDESLNTFFRRLAWSPDGIPPAPPPFPQSLLPVYPPSEGPHIMCKSAEVKSLGEVTRNPVNECTHILCSVNADLQFDLAKSVQNEVTAK